MSNVQLDNGTLFETKENSSQAFVGFWILFLPKKSPIIFLWMRYCSISSKLCPIEWTEECQFLKSVLFKSTIHVLYPSPVPKSYIHCSIVIIKTFQGFSRNKFLNWCIAEPDLSYNNDIFYSIILVNMQTHFPWNKKKIEFFLTHWILF